jgi:hypothetical protein
MFAVMSRQDGSTGATRNPARSPRMSPVGIMGFFGLFFSKLPFNMAGHAPRLRTADIDISTP